MLRICDKVTIRGWGDRIFTIIHISNDDSTIKYRGFDREYMVPSDLHKESEMTVVEPTTEPNTITVGDDVLVSKYSDIRMMQFWCAPYPRVVSRTGNTRSRCRDHSKWLRIPNLPRAARRRQ